jgi:hypothetical protein
MKPLNLLLALLISGLIGLAVIQQPSKASEVYGPTNMLKTLRNPFMGTQGADTSDGSSSLTVDSPISIDETDRSEAVSNVVRSISQRLAAPSLYLPGRLVMGQPAEFVVKGKSGSYAALAMADRDSGAKPVYGHVIHLGPDRKVVTVGKIPESGLLHLWIEAPFEGDLMGLPLFFEAAVWSQDDFSDVQIAIPVKSEIEGTEAAGKFDNGIIMAACESVLKKDPIVIHETSETSIQHMQYAGPHLDSGRP